MAQDVVVARRDAMKHPKGQLRELHGRLGRENDLPLPFLLLQRGRRRSGVGGGERRVCARTVPDLVQSGAPHVQQQRMVGPEVVSGGKLLMYILSYILA